MCALCRQALASSENAGLIQGFYWSIALMIGVPLIIMTVVAVIAWRHHRRRLPALIGTRQAGLRPDTVGGAHDA